MQNNVDVISESRSRKIRGTMRRELARIHNRCWCWIWNGVRDGTWGRMGRDGKGMTIRRKRTLRRRMSLMLVAEGDGVMMVSLVVVIGVFRWLFLVAEICKHCVIQVHLALDQVTAIRSPPVFVHTSLTKGGSVVVHSFKEPISITLYIPGQAIHTDVLSLPRSVSHTSILHRNWLFRLSSLVVTRRERVRRGTLYVRESYTF